MTLLRRLADAILVPRPAPPAPLGGLPFEAVYPSSPGQAGTRQRAPGGLRVIPASIESQLLASANIGRTMLTIVNDSTSVLFVAHGRTASSAMYTVKLAAGATYIIETPDAYQGEVAGVWASATGQATVSETTDGQ